MRREMQARWLLGGMSDLGYSGMLGRPHFCWNCVGATDELAWLLAGSCLPGRGLGESPGGETDPTGGVGGGCIKPQGHSVVLWWNSGPGLAVLLAGSSQGAGLARVLPPGKEDQPSCLRVHTTRGVFTVVLSPAASQQCPLPSVAYPQLLGGAVPSPLPWPPPWTVVSGMWRKPACVSWTWTRPAVTACRHTLTGTGRPLEPGLGAGNGLGLCS